MLTQEQEVFNYMQKHNGITSLEMTTILFICSPTAVIRNLRRKYDILDDWLKIEKKYTDKKGKVHKKVKNFKRWYFA